MQQHQDQFGLHLFPLVLKSQHFGSTTALGRAGQMVECTDSYVFLASEVASYITGQTIHINGGEMVTSKLKISHLVVKKFNDLFFYKGLLKK